MKKIITLGPKGTYSDLRLQNLMHLTHGSIHKLEICPFVAKSKDFIGVILENSALVDGN